MSLYERSDILMEELKKINSKIAVKQIGRIVGGSCFMVLGMVLVARHMYQKGITDCQISISNEFPDEYAAITKKVVEAFEKH